MTARISKLDGSAPTVAALLKSIRPGYLAGRRHVQVFEAPVGWSWDTHGKAMLAYVVGLAGAHPEVLSETATKTGEALTLTAPETDGFALVLIDRHMGTDGNVALVVREGAIDYAAVEPVVDALLAGDVLLAQLSASTTGPGARVVLALAESRALELRAREIAAIKAQTAEEARIAELEKQVQELQLARQLEADRADRAEARSRDLARQTQWRAA